MKKIREFMKVCQLEFGWINKGTLGTYDFDKCIIKLNVALLVIETFVHEALHREYPDASEKEIIKKTSKKIGRLTRSEMSEIGDFIFETFTEEVKNEIKRHH